MAPFTGLNKWDIAVNSWGQDKVVETTFKTNQEVTTPTRKDLQLGDVYKKLLTNACKKMLATFFASYFIVLKRAVSGAHRRYPIYINTFPH